VKGPEKENTMHSLKDVNLKLTLALPNGAATTTSTSIDSGKTTAQGEGKGVELLLTAPALNTTQQPDAKTLKYDILHSDNSDLSSPTVYITTALTQTGAGGAGAAANTFRCRMASDAKRYWGFRATGSASGNASGASATLEPVF
jgi:hypothetical protein